MQQWTLKHDSFISCVNSLIPSCHRTHLCTRIVLSHLSSTLCFPVAYIMEFWQQCCPKTPCVLSSFSDGCGCSIHVLVSCLHPFGGSIDLFLKTSSSNVSSDCVCSYAYLQIRWITVKCGMYHFVFCNGIRNDNSGSNVIQWLFVLYIHLLVSCSIRQYALYLIYTIPVQI